MSSITASTLLPSLTFHGHGHRRGAQTSGNSVSSPIGQLPVGVSSNLFSGLVQSFQQALGATPAASGVSSPAALQGTAAANQPAGPALAGMTPGQQQELQAFQHSLFQALKQDGLELERYRERRLLAQHAHQSARARRQIDRRHGDALGDLPELDEAGVNGAGAATASSSSSSSSALQNFLKNLLQNVQAGGVQSLASAGNNVNTHV